MEQKKPKKYQLEQQPPTEVIAETKEELVSRDIKVFTDGSVEIKETQLITTKMGGRDFISWLRRHESTRDDIVIALSDETRTKTEENLKRVEDDIEKLKPYIEKSEKNVKEHYEKLKKDGMISKIAEELNKNMSDINLDYMSQVWHNLIENEQDVLDVLTQDQKQKFLKIKVKMMAKNRGKKKR